MLIGLCHVDTNGYKCQISDNDDGRQPLFPVEIFEEHRGHQGQEDQGGQIAKGGGDGRGHVVGVDVEAAGGKDHQHHYETWKQIQIEFKLDKPTILYSTVQPYTFLIYRQTKAKLT